MSKRATTKKNLHVIPNHGGWAVRGEGSSRVTSVHDTQREAIEAAREIARNQSSELVIHGRDGRVRERDSYSSDPLPPREPREVLFPPTTSTTSKKAIEEAVSEVIRESNGGSRKESRDEARG